MAGLRILRILTVCAGLLAALRSLAVSVCAGLRAALDILAVSTCAGLLAALGILSGLPRGLFAVSRPAIRA